MSSTASGNNSKANTSRRPSVTKKNSSTKNKTSTRDDVTITEVTTTEVTTTEGTTAEVKATEAAKYAALATHYVWTKAALMILLNYIVLWTLVWNFKQFKLIKNFQEPVTDKHLHLFLAINFGSLAAGSIGFGRPYLPPILCFIGMLIIAFGLRNYGGLVKWTETFFAILSIWSLILEYFYIGYQYWSYSDTKKIFYRLFFILLTTSVISIYHSYNYDSSS